MNIQGKSALVTGGASGLGAATVRMLATQGARVVIADVNEKGGNELAQELGASVKFVKTDVTDDAQVAAAVEAAVKNHGGLHILVATAGIGFRPRSNAGFANCRLCRRRRRTRLDAAAKGRRACYGSRQAYDPRRLGDG